jgi:hypothetical protein
MDMREEQGIDFTVDRQNLYREEVFTDLKVATIRRLTPVKPDGDLDKTRKVVYVGQTNLMTPNGPVPVQGIISAKDLQQAIKRFPDAMNEAMAKLVEQVEKLKQKEDSRIIVPGQ